MNPIWFLVIYELHSVIATERKDLKGWFSPAPWDNDELSMKLKRLFINMGYF